MIDRDHDLPITLDACHAKEMIEQAFARHGVPEIVNTDQGSQFTATEFTDVVIARGSRAADAAGEVRGNLTQTGAGRVRRVLRCAPSSTYKSGKSVQTNGATSIH